MSSFNLPYRLACLYMGMTEEHDRSLTDMRDRYDPTEAFVYSYYNDIRSLSNRYAIDLRNKILKEYCISWKDIRNEIQKHSNYSSQYWVDEYRRIWS